MKWKIAGWFLFLLLLGRSSFAEKPGESFFDAANRGDVSAVKRFLEKGAKVEAFNPDGKTALMLAAEGGQTEIVKLLLENGANPNKTEKPLCDNKTGCSAGKTAILYASAEGQTDIVKLLIAKGANAASMKQALRVAAKQGHTLVVQTLIANGTDVNSVNRVGYTPLMFAVGSNRPDTLQALLDGGARIDTPRPDGNTALGDAISLKHKEAAVCLMDRGAGINLKNKHGETPLFFAVGSREPDLVKILLAKGADANITTGNGLTPFWAAVASFDYQSTWLLFKASPWSLLKHFGTIILSLILTVMLLAFRFRKKTSGKDRETMFLNISRPMLLTMLLAWLAAALWVGYVSRQTFVFGIAIFVYAYILPGIVLSMDPVSGLALLIDVVWLVIFLAAFVSSWRKRNIPEASVVSLVSFIWLSLSCFHAYGCALLASVSP